MSIENTLVTLNKEHAKAQAQADALKAAIKALGGTVADGTGKAPRKRSRGGWPKGKPRGAKSSTAPANGEAGTSPIAEARARRAASKPGASLAEAAS